MSCVYVVVVVVCACGAVWHAENPPCVHSKRPRVYRHHGDVLKYTRGPFERTLEERGCLCVWGERRRAESA